MACIAWGGEFGGVRREGTMLYVVGLGKGRSQGGVICISEVIDISPGNLDSCFCFILPLLIQLLLNDKVPGSSPG